MRQCLHLMCKVCQCPHPHILRGTLRARPVLHAVCTSSTHGVHRAQLSGRRRHGNPDQKPGGRSTVCTAVNVAVQLRERHTRANNNYHWDWCVVTAAWCSQLCSQRVWQSCAAKPACWQYHMHCLTAGAQQPYACPSSNTQFLHWQLGADRQRSCGQQRIGVGCTQPDTRPAHAAAGYSCIWA